MDRLLRRRRPACDLAINWTLFEGDSRRAFASHHTYAHSGYLDDEVALQIYWDAGG